jgi:hypothetical protein
MKEMGIRLDLKIIGDFIIIYAAANGQKGLENLYKTSMNGSLCTILTGGLWLYTNL